MPEINIHSHSFLVENKSVLKYSRMFAKISYRLSEKIIPQNISNNLFLVVMESMCTREGEGKDPFLIFPNFTTGVKIVFVCNGNF